jgi:GDP-L-fucose synthase
MKVLVTGGNGFVGKHVVAALNAAGHEVVAPTSKEWNWLVCGDMLSADVLPSVLDTHITQLRRGRFDAVIHLATICGGIGINKDNPGKFMYENLQMGLNVVEACRLAHIKKLVNLSTVCSYPKHTPVPFKESDIWNGYPEETNAPYGIAKKAIVELGIAYARQYGLNVTNLVPVNMAGEFDHFDLYSSHVIPAIIKKFESPLVDTTGQFGISPHNYPKKYVELWGSGRASREFLYAGDCAKAIVSSLDKNTGPDPINLGTGREITIQDLATLIKKIGGYDADIVWVLSKPDGQPRRSLDTSRAKQVLGWEATTPIEETVRRTIEWYRANHG